MERPLVTAESTAERKRKENLHERRLDTLASRIHALEDALLLESGDSHPLSTQSRLSIGSYYQNHASSSKTSWMDHQMEAGTLLMKDTKSEALLGAVAVEVRLQVPHLYTGLMPKLRHFLGSTSAGM